MWSLEYFLLRFFNLFLFINPVPSSYLSSDCMKSILLEGCIRIYFKPKRLIIKKNIFWGILLSFVSTLSVIYNQVISNLVFLKVFLPYFTCCEFKKVTGFEFYICDISQQYVNLVCTYVTEINCLIFLPHFMLYL